MAALPRSRALASSIATKCIRPCLEHKGSSSGPSPLSDLRLVFLGGPGVGKGTYAKMLSKELSVPHISTGDLVRAELSSSSSSKLREAVREVVNQGRLLPDDIVLELLSNRLRGVPAGFILDGFPRTLHQVRILDEALPPVDMAVNLQLEDEALVAKCLGRRVCSHCGTDYNLAHLDTHDGQRRLFLPARRPPPASACASALSVRGDDANEDVVRERLRVHARESASVEEHYRLQGRLVDLDVGPGMDAVWPRLLQIVTGLGSSSSSKNTSSGFQHNQVSLPHMLRC